ncbi:RNA polymerase II transcription factor TFIIH subunit [Naegleria gruberi]|uniref:RNA polymerase II transcription factor TFIIH subunit n=1 Tax=Naegleria gruberi TaxID=5762 RepID=D2V005_NAEGR|nr:RNA polymerase II transcription factor TFIIH subunit [Naegleria gruberi]EFC50254.1 RNA polymerase II transcription factor TFIIH subunit [Naegleria gruberi]|eukprot:XP_002682998.1 RNA polymerase II transcription factor TFIIH subunit [Naegleria gruberi strain NEG-M]
MYWNAANSTNSTKSLIPQEKTIIKKGIIRFLYLVIDCSNGIMLPSQHDEKTSRAQSVISTAKEFIKEYFDQNPLSQLGIITTKNGVAKILKELTGNVKQLVSELKKSFGGDPSLQNVLNLSYDSLHQIPNYGSKEVVVIYCSLSSCDPDNIFSTIKQLKDNNIRVSLISLDAEVFVCKQIAKQTQGTYSVPTDDEHFKEVLMAHAAPPPTTSSSSTKIVAPPSMRMGFPQRRAQTLYSMCLCHKKITPGGYICPRCKSKYCDLPVECSTCGLMLVSSPHLARSYHHLFPVQQFIDYQPREGEEPYCYGCQKSLPKESFISLQCPSCSNIFCVECDAFIHESLHNCPGCN